MAGSPLTVSCTPGWLVVRFSRPHWTISSAIVGGGERVAGGVVWHEVRNAELTKSVDPARLLRRRMAARDLSGAVGLLTSCSLRSHVVSRRTCDGITARVVATVGLGNALRVGDPPGLGRRVDTINILCHLSVPLSREGRIEALTIVAEARTLAVLEASVPSLRSARPSTGTGTDCIVVACPRGPRAERYAGKHTALGHVVGAAVADSVRRGVSRWMEKR